MSGACRPVDDWPDLLLGPMVRRVTATSVSVFVATSIECDVQLAVRTGRRHHSEIADADFDADTAVTLDRIGERLWVGLVQGWLPPDARAGDPVSYDVRLVPPEGFARRLSVLGELGTADGDPIPAAILDPVLEAVPLGYEPGMLPSFVVPPRDVASLRLAHASCRKPHGGQDQEPDALTILDQVIALSLGVADPMPGPDDPPPPSNRERPHQLVLTGDQIYADDVAAGLLEALIEAGGLLLGWEERIPGILPLGEFMVWPGWRSRFLEMAGIEDAEGYANNHLITFAEWCAMYLFAWSDALWARSEDGKGVTLPDADSRLHVGEMISFAGWIEWVLNRTQPSPVPIIPPQYTRWFELAAMLDEHPEALAEDWKNTLDQAMGFGATVRVVRRLLANVATYTMFDDHEINDDWFLNREVTDAWLGIDAPTWNPELEELGPRVLRNGLSAYAIFQHWGNAPADFGRDEPGDHRNLTSHGVRLLDMWSVAAGTTGVLPPTLAAEPRVADRLLGIDVQPSPIPAPGTPRAGFARFRWDYAITFPTHRLIALDTRTWRSFPDAVSPAWPTDVPPAPQSPRDVATRAYVQQAADAWARAATTVGSDEANLLAAMLQACVDAATTADAGRLPDTTSALGELADRAEELLRPPLWTAAGTAAAGVQLRRFRGDLAETTGDTTPGDRLWQGALFLERVAGIPTEDATEPLTHSLAALGRYLEAEASGSELALVYSIDDLLDAVGSDAMKVLTDNVDAHATVALVVNTAGPVLVDAFDRLLPDVRSDKFFRDGSHQLAAALIAEEALAFQLTDHLPTAAPDAPGGADVQPVVLVSPAPIFGHPLVESLQRAKLIGMTLLGAPGAVVSDYEAWSCNGPALNDLIAAARVLPRCVVLSGDVHYGGSSVNDVTLRTARARTRYVQLTSSAARNSDGQVSALGFADDLLWADNGAIDVAQFGFGKVAAAEAAGVEGPTLLGWADEVLEEWFEETFSLETFMLWLLEQADDLPQSPLDVILWPARATYNTLTSWAAEVAFLTYSTINMFAELRDDPLKKILGDYLYARDVLRQQLVDFYDGWGIDPAFGHQVKQTLLQDLRHRDGARLDRYGARERYPDPTTDIARFADEQWVQTVGANNVGLVRFVTDGGVVRGVVHELLWYPKPEPERHGILEHRLPPGLVFGVRPRADWMGTRHGAAWTAEDHRLPAEAAELPVPDPVVDDPVLG